MTYLICIYVFVHNGLTKWVVPRLRAVLLYLMVLIINKDGPQGSDIGVKIGPRRNNVFNSKVAC